MKYLATLLVPILVSSFMAFVNRHYAKEALKYKHKEHVVICMPGYFKWVGLVNVIVCSFFPIGRLLIPNIIVGGSFWDACLWFSPMIIMGLSIIIIGTVWKIHIFRDEDQIIYTTFFGKTYTIPYSSITYYKQYFSTIVVKVGKKRFYVDIMAHNVKTLLRQFRIHKVYRKP